MADTDPAKGLINIIYMVVGKSTALFKTLQVGQSYLDVIGPLGQPTHLEKVGKVICVGGGTGIAVLHPIARGLKQVGNYVYLRHRGPLQGPAHHGRPDEGRLRRADDLHRRRHLRP